MSFWDKWTVALSPRINASEFEQKLLDVEDLIQNHCTSENWSQCAKSFSYLNKLLNQRVRPEDRARFIKRMVDLQATLASYQTFFAESSSNKNFRRNMATHRTPPPQNSRSNSRQQDHQRSSTKPTEYYNKSASYSSTVVIDLEKDTEDYNQKTNAVKKLPINQQQKFNTQSKHELNDNAENKTYNLRSSSFSSSVRTDNQQQRFPETYQNRPTEQEMRQKMNNAYRSFSDRTDENQISSASKKHQNGNKSTTKNPTLRMENNGEHLEENRYGFHEDRKDEYHRKPEEQQHCNRYEGNNQSQTFTGGIFEQQHNRNQDVRAGEETVHTILPSFHYNLPSIHGLSQNTNQMIDKVSHVNRQQSGDYQKEEAFQQQQQQQQQYNSRWESSIFTGPGDTTEFYLLPNYDKIKAPTVGKEAAYNNRNENCYNFVDENMRREVQQFEWIHQRNNQGNFMEHTQTGSYGHEFEQQSSWNKPSAPKYENNYKGNVALPTTETGYKDFEDNQSIDNWSLNDPRKVAQTSGLYPNEFQRQYQQQKQQFGHYDKEHQRRCEEEEEEEEAALQQAQRHQREVEEQRQRQERQKLQLYQRQLEEQRIKEKERQQQQQTEELNKTEIVDISDKFIDDSIKKHPDKNNLEYFQVIRDKAKSFEHSIEQFKGDDYMEYFILHENLMQLIEIMDRIRCEKDETLFPHKIDIIEYIKRLIEDLDARNQS